MNFYDDLHRRYIEVTGAHGNMLFEPAHTRLAGAWDIDKAQTWLLRQLASGRLSLAGLVTHTHHARATRRRLRGAAEGQGRLPRRADEVGVKYAKARRDGPSRRASRLHSGDYSVTPSSCFLSEPPPNRTSAWRGRSRRRSAPSRSSSGCRREGPRSWPIVVLLDLGDLLLRLGIEPAEAALALPLALSCRLGADLAASPFEVAGDPLDGCLLAVGKFQRSRRSRHSRMHSRPCRCRSICFRRSIWSFLRMSPSCL